MEKDNRSYNSTFSVITRQFLVPSWPKVLLHLLVGALVLVLWNAKNIWQQFNNDFLAHDNSVSSGIVSHQASGIEKTLDNLWGGRLAQILFWALAGCIVYVCIWFAINVFTNVRNDVVADEYVHPEGYSRSSYWGSILARKVFLVVSGLILIGFFITSLRLFPLLAKLLRSALQDFRPSPGIVEVAGSILAAGFLIYLLVLLVHIVVNSWRAVYTDL